MACSSTPLVAVTLTCVWFIGVFFVCLFFGFFVCWLVFLFFVFTNKMKIYIMRHNLRCLLASNEESGGWYRRLGRAEGLRQAGGLPSAGTKWGGVGGRAQWSLDSSLFKTKF